MIKEKDEIKTTFGDDEKTKLMCLSEKQYQ